MITIAAVTLVFLPGTFVCTVVSTNFFDFGKQGLVASRQWWILLAVALPLTIIVLAVWTVWSKFRAKKHKRKAVQTESDMETYGVSMSRRRKGAGLAHVRGGARHGTSVKAVPAERSY